MPSPTYFLLTTYQKFNKSVFCMLIFGNLSMVIAGTLYLVTYNTVPAGTLHALILKSVSLCSNFIAGSNILFTLVDVFFLISPTYHSLQSGLLRIPFGDTLPTICSYGPDCNVQNFRIQKIFCSHITFSFYHKT